jgi:hypothetical protein
MYVAVIPNRGSPPAILLRESYREAGKTKGWASAVYGDLRGRHAGIAPAFSGGTSLSKGWELIKRFSEDIDFKVGEPAAKSASLARRERTAYRERVLEALTAGGFGLEAKPVVGNESRFFSADLSYGGEFEAVGGLRPHIRVEMSFQPPALPPVARPIQSLMASAQKAPPEVAAFLCVPTLPEVVEALNEGEYEVNEASVTRYSLRDLLDWAIDRGYFDEKTQG